MLDYAGNIWIKFGNENSIKGLGSKNSNIKLKHEKLNFKKKYEKNERKYESVIEDSERHFSDSTAYFIHFNFSDSTACFIHFKKEYDFASI